MKNLLRMALLLVSTIALCTGCYKESDRFRYSDEMIGEPGDSEVSIELEEVYNRKFGGFNVKPDVIDTMVSNDDVELRFLEKRLTKSVYAFSSRFDTIGNVEIQVTFDDDSTQEFKADHTVLSRERRFLLESVDKNIVGASITLYPIADTKTCKEGDTDEFFKILGANTIKSKVNGYVDLIADGYVVESMPVQKRQKYVVPFGCTKCIFIGDK